ncbi:hypothetical protein LguiA_013860 [Lonicera macranthoides]
MGGVRVWGVRGTMRNGQWEVFKQEVPHSLEVKKIMGTLAMGNGRIIKCANKVPLGLERGKIMGIKNIKYEFAVEFELDMVHYHHRYCPRLNHLSLGAGFLTQKASVILEIVRTPRYNIVRVSATTVRLGVLRSPRFGMSSTFFLVWAWLINLTQVKHYRLHYQPPIHNHGTSAIRNLLSVSHSRCHQALTPNNQLRRDCQEGFS